VIDVEGFIVRLAFSRLVDQKRIGKNTPGVFDQTGGHLHLNGAPIEVSRQSEAGKCPDSGGSELGIDVGFWGGFRDGKEDGKRLRPSWKKF